MVWVTHGQRFRDCSPDPHLGDTEGRNREVPHKSVPWVPPFSHFHTTHRDIVPKIPRAWLPWLLVEDLAYVTDINFYVTNFFYKNPSLFFLKFLGIKFKSHSLPLYSNNLLESITSPTPCSGSLFVGSVLLFEVSTGGRCRLGSRGVTGISFLDFGIFV